MPEKDNCLIKGKYFLLENKILKLCFIQILV